MREPAAVWEGIKNVFLGFVNNWIIIPEAIVLFVILYFVMRTLSENNAKKLIVVYVFLLLLSGAVALFSEHFTVTVFFLFVFLMSVFFLLLFSVEIKRGVYNSGKRATNTVTESAVKATAVNARAEVYVGNIVKAVQGLSKSNTGALIVLSNGNLPKNIIESGVTLNAAISNQLIEGIFINKAPLHDGAMIIYGDKIQAAGCFLPLTQREFPKDYGTRHRAGIGVTEVADVSTIIVSEETGIVSVVKQGKITRYVDSESLKRFLREYYWKEFSTEAKKK